MEGFPGGSAINNLPAIAGDVDSIPWSERSPWRRAWQPTPVFLPGKPMDRGAGRATAHGVAKSQTWLNNKSHWIVLEEGLLNKNDVITVWKQPLEANRMEAAGGRGSLGSTWEGYNVIIMAKKGGSLKNPTFSQGEEMLEVVRESLRL